MSLENKREPLAVDKLSLTKIYHSLSQRQGYPDFLYYSQPIKEETPSPVWEDLLYDLNVEPGRVAGVLYEGGDLVWANHVQHADISSVAARTSADMKAFVSLRKIDRSEPGFPEITHKAKVQVSNHELSDSFEEGCQYAHLAGDYLGRNLAEKKETVQLEIEVADTAYKTIFSGTLAEYQEQRESSSK